MRFDLTKFPFDEKGDRVKDEKGVEGSYQMAFMKALIADFDPTGQPIRGAEKFKRYDMYVRVKASVNYINLEAEDVVFLTEVCRDAFPILVAGQCRDFLRSPDAGPSDPPPA